MTSSALLPVMLALVSAGGFAVSTSVQHRAAGAVAATGPGLLLRLSRRPLWLAGAAVGFSAWLLHGVALSLGDLAIVQPLMLSTVVFALVVRAALDRTTPSPAELAAAALTVGSLVLFLLSCPAAPGSGAAHETVAAIIAATAVVATTVLVSRDAGTVPAWALAVAAGGCFAVTAALLKLTGGTIAAEGVAALPTSWSTYALAVCGVLGVMASQQAYQGGRLAETLPLANVVTALGAFALGVVVFGQRVSGEPWQLACATVGLVGIFAGLRHLGAPPRSEALAS